MSSTYSDLARGKAAREHPGVGAPAREALLDLDPSATASAPRSARLGDLDSRPTAPARVLSVTRALVSIPALCGYAYLALGLWLMLGLGFYEGDSLSRTANALYVVAGRDPHVAAIGFVWNPLPSIVQIPLVLALDRFGYAYLAGPIESALFATLTLVVLDRTLRLLEVGTFRRRALLLLYGLNPMILFYAANGMSESPLLFFMVAGTYQFLRWTRGGGVQSLLVFSLLSAGTFLVRYEGLAFCAGGVVALTIAFFIGKDLQPDRLEAILLTYLVPVSYVAALWLFFNWVFVGDPFYFYSSTYGNLAQTAGFRSGAQTYLSLVVGNLTTALGYAFERWIVVMPAILPLAALGAFRGLFRREHVTLGVLAMAGALPAFHAYLVYGGTSFGWLRFFLYGIPFAVVVAPLVLEPLRGLRRRYRAAWAVTLILVAAGIPTSLWAMTEPDLGREEWEITRHLIDPRSAPVPPSFTFTTDKEIAAYVDALPGKPVVLMDSAYAFAIDLFGHDHSRYAITSDRDFKAILGKPDGGVITHILVPEPHSVEAVGSTLIGIWQNGKPYAALVRDFGGLNGWRLYAVTPSVRR